MTIESYAKKYRPQIVAVWERSVQATHHFLSPADFEEIKAMVQELDFSALDVYCLIDQETDAVAGFIGVADQKIEMLFLDPDHIGQGLGKRLTSFALTNLKANKVDVNEQNTEAVAFYKHLGFEVYERTKADDQGRNYPLLRMEMRSAW